VVHGCLSREDVLGVLATTLRFTEEEKVTVGLLTEWEVQRAEIAAKASSAESGFSFGDAWTAFLNGS
jgi:hypothetical protein